MIEPGTSDVLWVALISAGAAVVVALMTQLLATRAASKQADRLERREAVQWQRSEAIRKETLAREATQAAQALALAEAQQQRTEAIRQEALAREATQAAQALALAEAQRQRTEAIRQEALAHEATQAAQALALAEAQRLRALHEAQLQALWGYVLAARWQMLDALERVPVQGRPAQPAITASSSLLPANAAGQAYGAALLDLVAVRPAAKAFYLATSKLQLALQAGDETAMRAVVQEWASSYQALEQGVADLADSWRGAGDATVVIAKKNAE